MATYIKGVKDYIPQLETFTPDYKFLSDVLQTRQDRYDTNYKTLNDLYSKVVYGDLSREDNEQKRNQYANQLSEGLKQVSGLDLSISQNVEAARGLFRPFFEDKALIKDMAFTKMYKQGLQNINRMQSSSNEEFRDRYWNDGMIDFQYQMQKFKEGSAEEALAQGMPKYVQNPNLYERSFEALKDSGLSIEQTTLEGDWIIKTKNGTALTRQLVGYEKGKDGKPDKNKPIYRNPAGEYLKETVMRDPLVIQGYMVQARNRARQFANDPANIELYGSVENAKKEWANKLMTEQDQRNLEKLAQENMEVSKNEGIVFNWEDYKKKHGIIPGTAEEEVYLKNLATLELAKKTRDLTQERVKQSKAPQDNLDNYLNVAYQNYMASIIGEKMTAAAIAYSQVDASQTFEANPFRKMLHQHTYDMNRMAVQYQYDMNKIATKAKFDMALAERKAELEMLGNNVNGGIGGGIGGEVDVSNADMSITGIDPDEIVPTEHYNERLKAWATNIDNDKVQFINDLMIKQPAAFQNTDYFQNGQLTFDTGEVDANNKPIIWTGSIQDGFKTLTSNEKYRGTFDRIVKDAFSKFEDITETSSGARSFKQLPTLNIDAATQIKLINQYSQVYAAESQFNSAISEYNSQVKAATDYLKATDSDFQEASKESFAIPVMTERQEALYAFGIPLENVLAGTESDWLKGFLNKEFTVRAKVDGGFAGRASDEGDRILKKFEGLDNTNYRVYDKQKTLELTNMHVNADGLVKELGYKDINDYLSQWNKPSNIAGFRVAVGDDGQPLRNADGSYVFNTNMPRYYGGRVGNMSAGGGQNGGYYDPNDTQYSSSKRYNPDGTLITMQDLIIPLMEESPLIRSYWKWQSPNVNRAENLGWRLQERNLNKAANRYFDGDKDSDDKGDDGLLGAINQVFLSANSGETVDENGVTTGVPGFNIDAYMVGQPYQGVGQAQFKEYTAQYDHALKSSVAMQHFNSLNSAIQNNKSAIKYGLGDIRTSDPNDIKGTADNSDAKMAAMFFDILKSETKTMYGQKNDRVKRPQASVSYVELAGGGEGEQDYAAYVIKPTGDFADKFKNLFDMDTAAGKAGYNKLITEGATYFVPTDQDNNPYKLDNQIISATDIIINQDGEYKGEIVNGGSFRFYKDANGQYVREITPYGLNDQGNIVPDPVFASNLVISKAELDMMVRTTEEYLKSIMETNVSSQSAWKKGKSKNQ